MKKIKYYGLWVPILALIIMASAVSELQMAITPAGVAVILLFSFLAALYIYTENEIAIKNGYGIEQLPLIPDCHMAMYQPSHRFQHLHTSPPLELLKKEPTGLILGKANGMYACVEPCKIGATHTLVIGSSGSGKTSSVLLASLLCASEREDLAFILIDIKGELETKGFPKKERLKVFNPSDRSRCGFDFFSELSSTSGEEEILNCLRRIVYSLIPMKASIKDPFWVNAPRQVLLGIFLYGWLKKDLRTLPALADFASSKNLKTLLNEIVAEAEEYDTFYKILIPFAGKDSASETLSGIAMNITNALNLLKSDETLRFLLREKKEKISPSDIEKGFSIDLQVSDADLEKYSCILNLCLACCSDFLCRREENPERKIVLLIDELGRIAGSSGEISGLQQLLQIGRSRGVSVLLALQSWAALEGIYEKGACEDMLANLPYRLILQSQPDNKSTNEMAVAAFGKYLEEKKNYSKGKNNSFSVSYEEKDILLPADLLTLPEKRRAVLLSPYGAFMLEKCQYFKDKKIKNYIK